MDDCGSICRFHPSLVGGNGIEMGRSQVALLTCALFLLPACEGGVRSTITGTGPVEAPKIQIPDQVMGLVVQQEPVASDVEEVERPYLDAVSIFSLREEDLLRASFQISRFNRIARPKSSAFRRLVTAQLGGSVPEELQVGEVTVYSTSGNEQRVYAWIEDRGFFVLQVHQDFEFPRTLLRRLVDLEIDL